MAADPVAALPPTAAGARTAWFWRRLLAVADGHAPPDRRELEEQYTSAWLTEVPVASWFETWPARFAAATRVEVELDSPTELATLVDLGGGSMLRLRCRVEPSAPHKIDFQLLSPAMSPSSYEDLLVERDGRAVRVRDFGGDGPPLLLWHGSGCDATVWEALVPHLRGVRVLAQDLPGHGRSSLEQLTVADAIADADAVVSALRLRSPVVVGHSMGGWAALHFAATRECRALVCLDGPTDLAYEAMGLDPRHPGWLPDPPDVVADLDALRCPALVVLCSGTSAAEREWMVPFRARLHEHLGEVHPSIQVAWRPSDHMLLLSDPVGTAELLHQFLRSIGG